MSRRRALHRRCGAPAPALSLLGLLAAALAVPAWSPPAGAAAGAGPGVTEAAVAFIVAQQRPDGGFGQVEPGFPGFETPDAVLALADAAQPTLAYDPAAALAAVRSVRRDGHDGLHYLDDLADAGLGAGKAAQLVVVARAVGLDPAAFDPDGDGAADLVAAMAAGRDPEGSYGTFNDGLQVVLAHAALGVAPPAGLVEAVAAAQQANGGWSFTGDPGGSDEDVDTTGRAVQALVAGGHPADGPVVALALDFLARRQNRAGGWDAFGAPDPNSTAMAMLAVTAAGYDVRTPCWRQGRAPSEEGAYVSPEELLRASQAPDGHMASAGDAFGVSTFATSQAVQALTRVFQPLVVAPRPPCPATGYRLVAADGGVFTFGDAPFLGSAADRPLNQPVVGGAATPSGRGYWLFAADGGVFAFGDAPFAGSTGGLALRAPVVGGAPSPRGAGYWLFAADGGVFAFGDAAFSGSAADVALNAAVVGGAATSSGRGYLLFAADGGVFAFGDARFEGSAGGAPLNAPVVSGFRSPAGGYALAGADGGVFAFGPAPFLGSAAGAPLGRPVVGAAG